MTEEKAHSLGLLLSALIRGGWAAETASDLVGNNLRGVLIPAVKRATESGEEARRLITPFLEGIEEFPATLSEDHWGSFWLGYYHGDTHAPRGRPPGIVETAPRKPGGGRKPIHEEERQEPRRVTMDEGRWEWCGQQPGGASAYLRGLIDSDRRAKTEN